MAASAPGAYPCTATAATAAEDGGKENIATAAQLREQVVRRVLSTDLLNSVKVRCMTCRSDCQFCAPFCRDTQLHVCLPGSHANMSVRANCSWPLQAQLRARLFAELKQPGSSSGSTGGRMPPWLAAPQRSLSLQQHVLNCLVSEFLLAQRHSYTLSVFLAETGSGTLPRLGRVDMLRLLGVLPGSKVHALLACGTSVQAGAGRSAAEGSAATTGAGGMDAPAVDAGESLAERMVAALGVLGGRISTHASACQTGEDSAAAAWSSGSCSDAALATAGLASSQQLAARLAAIEEEYQRKSGSLGAAAAAGLEERMAAYQRECDARCAAQLEQRLAALRQGELAAAREEEAARHATALAAERAGLAAEHQRRMAALNKQVWPGKGVRGVPWHVNARRCLSQASAPFVRG